MTLDKATKILTHLRESTNSASRQECDEAYQLGIEALKREQHRRRWAFIAIPELLPGETEE